MPVVLRVGPYSFLFYASDGGEPAHVHVRRDRAEAKVWLVPSVRLERQKGYGRRELNIVMRLVREHRAFLIGAWDEFFGN